MVKSRGDETNWVSDGRKQRRKTEKKNDWEKWKRARCSLSLRSTRGLKKKEEKMEKYAFMQRRGITRFKNTETPQR